MSIFQSLNVLCLRVLSAGFLYLVPEDVNVGGQKLFNFSQFLLDEGKPFDFCLSLLFSVKKKQKQPFTYFECSLTVQKVWVCSLKFGLFYSGHH